jgi:hypothetical protein
MCEMDRDETRRGDKLAFNTARESGDFFYNFCRFYLFLFFGFQHLLQHIAWDSMAGQARAGQISTCTSSTSYAAEGESDNDRASEGRGEAERVDIPQRNATHARILAAFSFLLGDGCTRGLDRIG